MRLSVCSIQFFIAKRVLSYEQNRFASCTDLIPAWSDYYRKIGLEIAVCKLVFSSSSVAHILPHSYSVHHDLILDFSDVRSALQTGSTQGFESQLSVMAWSRKNALLVWNNGHIREKESLFWCIALYDCICVLISLEWQNISTSERAIVIFNEFYPYLWSSEKPLFNRGMIDLIALPPHKTMDFCF